MLSTIWNTCTKIFNSSFGTLCVEEKFEVSFAVYAISIVCGYSQLNDDYKSLQKDKNGFWILCISLGDIRK